MFELNENLEIKKEIFQGSIIYTIDNFYKNPQKIENYLFGEPDKIPLHKINEQPSFNNIHFEDRRHDLSLQEQYDTIWNLDIKNVYDFLSELCGQVYDTADIVTNCTRFKKHPFNDYKNYYWWPHRDTGYNGIVYFNHDSEHGTCFYDEEGYEKTNDTNEHEAPWGLKEDLIVLKTLEPKYNRLIFFDGYKFPHGMNICTDRYFGEEYRKNQVFFFDGPEFLREILEEEDSYDNYD